MASPPASPRVEAGTIEYVDKTPKIEDVIQKQKRPLAEGTADKPWTPAEVFEGLKMPDKPPDYLSAFADEGDMSMNPSITPPSDVIPEGLSVVDGQTVFKLPADVAEMDRAELKTAFETGDITQREFIEGNMELGKKRDAEVLTLAAGQLDPKTGYVGDVEGAPDYLTAPDEKYVIAEKEKTIPTNVFDMMAEGQKDAPEGMFFIGYDEDNRPKYQQMGYSTYLPETGKHDDGTDKSDTGWAHKFYSLDPESPQGQKFQEALVAQSYLRNINEQYDKRREEKEAKGGYSMESFLKASGGDYELSKTFMDQSGLSMGAGMDTWDSGGSLTGTGTALEKVSVPLIDTLKEQGITDKRTLADAEGIMHDVIKVKY